MKLMFLFALLTAVVQADVISDFQARLKTVHDYEATAAIRSDRGNMVVDYRAVRDQGIRTEIIQGQHQGAVVLYRPAVKDRMVLVQIGHKRLWRSVARLKLEDTPMVASILDTIGSDLAQGGFTVKPQVVTVEVGQPVSPGPDDGLGRDPDLGDAAAPSSLPSAETEKRKCWLLQGTHGDEREEVDLDQSTLWPVQWRRWKHGHLEVSADLWKLQINGSAKLE